MMKIRNINPNRFKRVGLATLTGTIVAGITTPALALFGSDKPALNAYKLCSVSLDKAAVGKDIAAVACAEALHPDDMGLCVERVAAKKVDANTALLACRSVRRPIELATCVSEIQKQDEKAVLTDVLEFCRRSLLPERYGQCVVGLNDKPLQIATPTGLTTCIDASDRPTDIELLRTFEPIDKVPSIRNPMGAPIMPPSFTPGPSTPTPAPTPTTTPQLF
jgi:hypothetical protein